MTLLIYATIGIMIINRGEHATHQRRSGDGTGGGERVPSSADGTTPYLGVGVLGLVQPWLSALAAGRSSLYLSAGTRRVLHVLHAMYRYLNLGT